MRSKVVLGRLPCICHLPLDPCIHMRARIKSRPSESGTARRCKAPYGNCGPHPIRLAPMVASFVPRKNTSPEGLSNSMTPLSCLCVQHQRLQHLDHDSCGSVGCHESHPHSSRATISPATSIMWCNAHRVASTQEHALKCPLNCLIANQLPHQ